MKKKERNYLLDWLEGFDWDFFITLNPNEAARYHHINTAFMAKRRWELNRWHNYSDRKLLGKRWSRNPIRTCFVAFPEIGPMSGLVHWHLVLRAAPSHKDPTCAYRSAWWKVCPDGQADIRPVGSGALSYSSKKLWTDFATENFVISKELHPDRHFGESRRVCEMTDDLSEWRLRTNHIPVACQLGGEND